MSVVQGNSQNTTYIKTNTATVMHFLWFVSVLLLVLVFGLCIFVAFAREDAGKFHWDENGRFYYTVNDNKVTVVEFVDENSESCVIPESVNYGKESYPVAVIGEHAFSNQNKLISVVIPDSVTEIRGDAENMTGAFSGCIALQQVKFGQGVTRIGEYAFKNCVNLKAIELPANVQFVDVGAFQGCLALETVAVNSNAVFGKACFDSCLKITTLKLSDEVRLSDNMREKFAESTKLSSFVISASNPVYTVHSVDDGICLLTTTENENDTVVMGGSGAGIPAGVTRILDWALGQRAKANLFVPASVQTIGENSFECAAICTDAATKPEAWSVNVVVNTQAEKITFVAADGSEAEAYVYYDANGLVLPNYENLFSSVVSETPFEDWGEISGGTCVAEYKSTARPTQSEIDGTLKNFLSDIKTLYLDNEELRQEFKFEFWENFKTLYYTALAINHPEDAYQYEVDGLTSQLNQIVAQINATEKDAAILENATWWVRLQNLVNAYEQIDAVDLASSVTTETKNKIHEKIVTANHMVEYHEKFDAETANEVLQKLRELMETLEVNVGSDSRLAEEIATCENLQSDNYTAASWQRLQNQLAIAKQSTSHSLLVSTVRRNLADARADLREVTLQDNLVRLKTWISICRDLPEVDYQSTGYDRLMLEIRTLIARADTLINNTKVNSGISHLCSLYNNLKTVDNTGDYQVSTGILNKKSLPYFIAAAVLFTGAVCAGAGAASLKKELRQTQE